MLDLTHTWTLMPGRLSTRFRSAFEGIGVHSSRRAFVRSGTDVGWEGRSQIRIKNSKDKNFILHACKLHQSGNRKHGGRKRVWHAAKVYKLLYKSISWKWLSSSPHPAAGEVWAAQGSGSNSRFLVSKVTKERSEPAAFRRMKGSDWVPSFACGAWVLMKHTQQWPDLNTDPWPLCILEETFCTLFMTCVT